MNPQIVYTLIFIGVIINFIIKAIIFIVLSRMFDKNAKILTIVKTFLIFEVLFFIFVFLYPEMGYGPTAFLIIPFILIFYLLFYGTNRLSELFDWKKGILFFLLMYLIIAPGIGYFGPGGRLVNLFAGKENYGWSELTPHEKIDLVHGYRLQSRILGELTNSIGSGAIPNYITFIIAHMPPVH